MKLWKTNDTGDNMYKSDILEKIWGKGFIIVEDMNYNTAQYIGRYTAKKCFGKEDEIIKSRGLKKEFIETSRRGGIAYQILENPKEWEKMKRNYGFFHKNKKGILKLEKIPQFIKNKWKELDRLDYFEESDKHRIQAENNFNEVLKKTSLNRTEYLQVQKRTLIAKLKATKSLKRNRF